MDRDRRPNESIRKNREFWLDGLNHIDRGFQHWFDETENPFLKGVIALLRLLFAAAAFLVSVLVMIAFLYVFTSVLFRGLDWMMGWHHFSK